MEQIKQRFVKNFENPYGFVLVKEVRDSNGNLRLSINEIWRWIYVAGYTPPGFCANVGSHYRNWRWTQYTPQEVLDTEKYDWNRLLKCIYALKIFDEKVAFCLAYLCDFGCLDNRIFLELILFADGIEKNKVTDRKRLQNAANLLFGLANRTFSDYVDVPQDMRKEYLSLCREKKAEEMPKMLEEHFNLEEVRIVFDLRDKGGHPRIRPYEIIAMKKEKKTPERFVDNPFEELKHIPLLEKIPHYVNTRAYNLVDTVIRITNNMPELTELQLFNLVCISDYGALTDNPFFDAMSRYEVYAKRNDEYKEDPYGYILDDLKSKLHILASHEG